MEGLDLINVGYQTLKLHAIGAFQDWIKQRDKDKGCYTCEAEKDKKVVWHAGHGFKKETFSGMIFSEETTKKQCDYCNVGLDGNREAFEEKLKQEYGEAVYNLMWEVALRTKNYKHSRLELIDIYNKYKSKSKELKK